MEIKQAARSVEQESSSPGDANVDLVLVSITSKFASIVNSIVLSILPRY